jgi:hypothetical protein
MIYSGIGVWIFFLIFESFEFNNFITEQSKFIGEKPFRVILNFSVIVIIFVTIFYKIKGEGEYHPSDA